MNKFVFVLLSICVCFFIGCASTNIDVNKVSPIAIITMRTNPEVTMFEDANDGSGFLTKYINLRDDSNNPMSTLTLGINAEAKLLAKLKDSPSFLPKQVVTSVRAYVKQKPSIFKGLNNRIIDGYKFFSETDTQRNAYILKELNAKSSMFVTFIFNKANFNSDTEIKFGDMHACVTMNVNMRNLNGKKIYDKQFQAISEQTVSINSNTLTFEEKEEFSQLFYPEMDRVIDEFIADFLGQNPTNFDVLQNTEVDSSVILNIDDTKDGVDLSSVQSQGATDATELQGLDLSNKEGVDSTEAKTETLDSQKIKATVLPLPEITN